MLPALLLALALSACASSKQAPAACRGTTFDLFEPTGAAP